MKIRLGLRDSPKVCMVCGSGIKGIMTEIGRAGTYERLVGVEYVGG